MVTFYQTTAWAIPEQGKPFTRMVIRRRDTGPQEVEIDVHYCGINHLDLHFIHNKYGNTKYPFVPGCEIGGRIVRVGERVPGMFKEGDHVAVGLIVESCKNCKQCQMKNEHACERNFTQIYNSDVRNTSALLTDGGYTLGGFSCRITVNHRYVLKVPSSISLKEVGPLMTSGLCAYSALRFWCGNKTRVGVVGCGAQGLLTIAMVSAMGNEVAAISSSEEKMTIALNAGADKFIHLASTPSVSSQKFDLVLNTMSQPHDLSKILPLIDYGGKIIQLGLITDPIKVKQFPDLHRNRISISASFLGGMSEAQQMLDFCARHNIRIPVEVILATGLDQSFATLNSNHGLSYRYVLAVDESYKATKNSATPTPYVPYLQGAEKNKKDNGNVAYEQNAEKKKEDIGNIAYEHISETKEEDEKGNVAFEEYERVVHTPSGSYEHEHRVIGNNKTDLDRQGKFDIHRLSSGSEDRGSRMSIVHGKSVQRPAKNEGYNPKPPDMKEESSSSSSPSSSFEDDLFNDDAVPQVQGPKSKGLTGKTYGKYVGTSQGVKSRNVPETNKNSTLFGRPEADGGQENDSETLKLTVKEVNNKISHQEECNSKTQVKDESGAQGTDITYHIPIRTPSDVTIRVQSLPSNAQSTPSGTIFTKLNPSVPNATSSPAKHGPQKANASGPLPSTKKKAAAPVNAGVPKTVKPKASKVGVPGAKPKGKTPAAKPKGKTPAAKPKGKTPATPAKPKPKGSSEATIGQYPTGVVQPRVPVSPQARGGPPGRTPTIPVMSSPKQNVPQQQASGAPGGTNPLNDNENVVIVNEKITETERDGQKDITVERTIEKDEVAVDVRETQGGTVVEGQKVEHVVEESKEHFHEGADGLENYEQDKVTDKTVIDKTKKHKEDQKKK